MTPSIETPESTNTEAANTALMDHADRTQERVLTETAEHIDTVLRTKPTFSRERPLGDNLGDFHRWKNSVKAEAGTGIEDAIDLARREALAEEERVFLRTLERSITLCAQEDTMGMEHGMNGMVEPGSPLHATLIHDFDLPTPPIELFENPYFAQRTLQYLWNRLPEEHREKAGFLLSLILKNQGKFEGIPHYYGERTKEKYHQIINVSDMKDLSLLGYGLEGKLTILGNPGAFTGAYMRGGELFVPGEVGIQACYQMHSGTAHIGKADSHLGNKMNGGTIFATDGGKGFVGSMMNGGTIFIENGGRNLGMYMNGKDAHIIAKKVGENCGIMMQNGIITILDSYDDKCPPLHPEDEGRIILPNGKVLKRGWWS